MLCREIGILGPVAHVPEFENNHWVITAVVMIETAMWATMPLRAEKLDRRFGLQVQFLVPKGTEFGAVLNEGNLIRGLSLAHKLLICWLRVQPVRFNPLQLL